MSQALRERVEELEEENLQLRATLSGMGEQRWRGVHLGDMPLVILGMLATGRAFSTEHFMNALQLRRPRDGDRYETTVGVYIWRIRRALKALDPPITIRNVWGGGYVMDPDDLARLLARKETQ